MCISCICRSVNIISYNCFEVSFKVICERSINCSVSVVFKTISGNISFADMKFFGICFDYKAVFVFCNNSLRTDLLFFRTLKYPVIIIRIIRSSSIAKFYRFSFSILIVICNFLLITQTNYIHNILIE